MKKIIILLGLLQLSLSIFAQKKNPETMYESYHNGNMIVAVDQFGRTFDAISSYKPDKQIGLFFWLWIGQPYATGIYDATKISQMPNGINLLYNFKYLNDSISPNLQAHFWGEPLWGYYNSEDEWVIRRQIQMLTVAGIDFIVFDATNYSTFRNVYQKVLKVIDEFIKDGWNPPKIVFYTHSRSIQTTKKLYDELYKANIYPDSWYRVNGKPLIIAYNNKEDDLNEAKQRSDKLYKSSILSSEILNFFYFKRPQWPFDPVYPDGFPWIEWTYPQPLHQNMMSVTVASHPNVPMSRSITHGVENWGRGWDPKLKVNLSENVDKGTFFQLQWDHALKVDPALIFVGGWNEWIAIKQPWGDEYMLCDAASKEFSRDIEPMKGGYQDAFYIQLIQNIRKYKGVNSSLQSGEFKAINISDGISQWDHVKNVYLNSDKKMQERNSYGASKTVQYNQPAPRNKLKEIKVCNDDNYLYFYIRAENNITANDGKENWMNLFIGTGSPSLKGWEGYEYVIGRKTENGKEMIEKLGEGFATSIVDTAEYRLTGNVMQIRVPRKLVDLKTGIDKFYFKVADGVNNPKDIMDYYVSGISLPLGRLSYFYNIVKSLPSEHQKFF